MCLVEAALSTAAFPFKAIPGVRTWAEPSLHTPDPAETLALTTNLFLLKATSLGSQIKVIALVVSLQLASNLWLEVKLQVRRL